MIIAQKVKMVMPVSMSQTQNPQNQMRFMTYIKMQLLTRRSQILRLMKDKAKLKKILISEK